MRTELIMELANGWREAETHFIETENDGLKWLNIGCGISDVDVEKYTSE